MVRITFRTGSFPFHSLLGGVGGRARGQAKRRGTYGREKPQRSTVTERGLYEAAGEAVQDVGLGHEAGSELEVAHDRDDDERAPDDHVGPGLLEARVVDARRARL